MYNQYSYNRDLEFDNYQDCWEQAYDRGYTDGFDDDIHKIFASITLPDNPTNGDMITTLFPDAKITITGDTVIIERFEPYCKCQFSVDWWNALYVKPAEDKE